MSSKNNQKALVSSRGEIEKYHNDYLSELNALAKIFITLSVAILGLTLSVLGPTLAANIAGAWFVSTWIFLLLTAILGFIEIYSFSRRFRAKAECLHNYMLVDTIIHLKGSDEKLDEFLNKADEANKKIGHSYNWCVRLVAFQASSLLVAFICLTVFVYKNFAIS